MLAEQDGIELAGEADSGGEALRQIERTRPDLVLLDIQMPELDGLALAAHHPPLPPIVFVTAYDEHAIRAFELNAVDYLLKPVRVTRLVEALRRGRARLIQSAQGFGTFPPPDPHSAPRVVTRSRGQVRSFDATKIARFWASDKYTLFVADGAEHFTEEPLSALEQRLRAFGYVRVHRAELVSAAAISKVVTENGTCVVYLVGGGRVSVSRRHVTALKRALRV
jgi:DNA-binding LytR/AlgR family response regulator